MHHYLQQYSKDVLQLTQQVLIVFHAQENHKVLQLEENHALIHKLEQLLLELKTAEFMQVLLPVQHVTEVSVSGSMDQQIHVSKYIGISNLIHSPLSLVLLLLNLGHLQLMLLHMFVLLVLSPLDGLLLQPHHPLTLKFGTI
jgi:hypothetical protein